MTIVKKLIRLGVSEAVILPKGWLRLQSQRLGAEIEEVLVTDHMNGLVIVPVEPTKEAAK